MIQLIFLVSVSGGSFLARIVRVGGSGLNQIWECDKRIIGDLNMG